MAHAQIKCVAMIQEEITTQALEALAEKALQVQERGRELTDKFHNLVEASVGACNAQVASDDPHVSVGAFWAWAKFEEKPFLEGRD